MDGSNPNISLQDAISIVADSREHRVLSKVKFDYLESLPVGDDVRYGAVIDVETTGLDTEKDEVIELGILTFAYRLDGDILGALEPYCALRDPGFPIPANVSEITGITDEMVAGQSIDPGDVAVVLQRSNLLISHHSAFDRKFLERICPMTENKPWACSIEDIDWAAEKIESTKLSFIAFKLGYFFEAHRASDDCEATLEALAKTLPVSGRTAMSVLLESARLDRIRLRLEDLPFSARDQVKSRGFRWDPGSSERTKSWFKDIMSHELKGYLDLLAAPGIGYSPESDPVKITAFNRFSARI